MSEDLAGVIDLGWDDVLEVTRQRGSVKDEEDT